MFKAIFFIGAFITIWTALFIFGAVAFGHLEEFDAEAYSIVITLIALLLVISSLS